MALIRFAEGQQRSGSIGATVYSHNRSGAYIRPRTVPVNPNTALQVQARNAARSLTIAWQNDLTQLQRDAWAVYSQNIGWLNKLGDPITLTGLNHYLRTNAINVGLGFGRIDDAPIIFNLAAAELELSGSGVAATQLLTIGFDDNLDWATEPGAFQHFYMGLPQNSGIGFFGGPWRYLTSVAGVTPAVSPKVATASFQFATDHRIWIRSRTMRADGRMSEFAETNFLVTIAPTKAHSG